MCVYLLLVAIYTIIYRAHGTMEAVEMMAAAMQQKTKCEVSSSGLLLTCIVLKHSLFSAEIDMTLVLSLSSFPLPFSSFL